MSGKLNNKVAVITGGTTGIGLATVQKIVRQYDGKVELLDTPGGGCTISLQFPSAMQNTP